MYKIRLCMSNFIEAFTYIKKKKKKLFYEVFDMMIINLAYNNGIIVVYIKPLHTEKSSIFKWLLSKYIIFLILTKHNFGMCNYISFHLYIFYLLFILKVKQFHIAFYYGAHAYWLWLAISLFTFLWEMKLLPVCWGKK